MHFARYQHYAQKDHSKIGQDLFHTSTDTYCVLKWQVDFRLQKLALYLMDLSSKEKALSIGLFAVELVCELLLIAVSCFILNVVRKFYVLHANLKVCAGAEKQKSKF